MATPTGSIIDRSFADAVNELNRLYDEDQLEALIEKGRGLLQDYAMPRYHRIRTLLLLSSTVGDWSEANGYREEAEMTWRITRRWHPAGENAEIDKALDELRGSLDEVQQALADEEVEGYDAEAEAAIEERIALHDEEVEREKELAIAEHGTEEEQLAADASALRVPTEELRKLDITKSHVKPLNLPLTEDLVGERPSSRMDIDKESVAVSSELRTNVALTEKPLPPLPTIKEPLGEAAHPSPLLAPSTLKRTASTNTMRSTYSQGTVASAARSSSASPTKGGTLGKGGSPEKKPQGTLKKKASWRSIF